MDNLLKKHIEIENNDYIKSISELFLNGIHLDHIVNGKEFEDAKNDFIKRCVT